MDMFAPLQFFANWISFGLLGFSQNSTLGESSNFFIYDSLKIFILLFVIIFVVTFFRSFLSSERVRQLLTRKSQLLGNILAALIGTVTPFCSCSAVPLFIGLVESGVPLGVTFSYLISAPMVNEVAAVLLFGLFGPVVAGIYILSGLTISIVVGFILGKMNLEYLVEEYVWKIKVGQQQSEKKLTYGERVRASYEYTTDLLQKVYPYVLLGVGLGAFIHGYAPTDMLTHFAGKENIFAVPIAVLVGVPLYSNAAGTIPIVKSLIEKGLPIGTSLAFMMSVTALSLPELIILRKVLKPRLLMIYVAILSVGIMFTGYLFNFLL